MSSDMADASATVFSWRAFADRVAIGLSLACAIHCLALPVLVATLPVISAMGLADESFHTWMVAVVVPISIFALFLGCRRHRSVGILLIGLAGLFLILLPFVLGHEVTGETGEKVLTLLGSVGIAYSHWLNFTRCRDQASDCCPG